MSDGGGGTTSLIATTGTISETGTLVAGTLSGSSAGTTSLSGATSTTNQIASLGTFTAQGFTLADGIGLTVSGAVNGGPSATVLDAGTLTVASGGSVTASAVSLTANDIAIAGLVSDGGGGTTSLIATTGTISETARWSPALLTGSAAGDATLTGTRGEQPGHPTRRLHQRRHVQPARWRRSDRHRPADRADHRHRHRRQQDDARRPGGDHHRRNPAAVRHIANSAFPDGRIPLHPPGTQGAYFTTAAGFTQQGSSTIRASAAARASCASTPAAAPTSRSIRSPACRAPNTWLILHIETGTAIGQINVQEPRRDPRGGLAGATDLTGTVDRPTGPAAAGAAGIQPSPEPQLPLQRCPIHVGELHPAAGEAVPTANPLNDINIGTLFNPNDEDDLLLPIVSDQDY